MGALGGALLLALIAAAAAAPLLTPHDPLAVDIRNGLAPPSIEHPLGTDHLGRDVLSRLLHGARASLAASGAVVALITAIGTAVGMVAGFYGGWVDRAVTAVMNVLLAFPSFILALVVAGLLGPGVRNVVLGLTLVRWVGCARVVRSLVLSLRERQYVEAARSIGAGPWRILWRHLAPNLLGTVLVLATLDLGATILSLSGLSFIGLGVQLPHPEWGAMLNHSRPYMQTAPRLMLFPGLAITLAVLSANLLGDALRDLLDPRRRMGGGGSG
jgi:peptide/nickel transport system permease protein